MNLSPAKRRKLLNETRELFELAHDAEHDFRLEMIEDLKFSFALEQWDEKTRKEREEEGRPALTIDRIGDTVRKILGSMRQNRPSIRVVPAEGGDKDTAQVYSDLIREIENSSRSRSVYQTAANSQVRCGYGVIGVKQVEADDDIWTQDLALQRYRNPFAVYFDPTATEQDKSDGRFVIIREWFTEKKFKEKWPKAKALDSNSADIGTRGELWYADKRTSVLKVWRKMPQNRTVLLLSDGRTVYRSDLSDEEVLSIDSGQLRIEREREVKSHKIVRYLMTASEVLEFDDWPGRFLPVVPVYGEEICIEGKTTYRGVTRTAKDPQRLYNYARTTTAEVLAEQPRAPYLVGVTQLSPDLQPAWDEANQGRKPYLPYDDSKNPNPPNRQPPPGLSSGYVQESATASDDLQRATGVFDPSLGARSNEVSGVAIEARQRGGDQGTFIYPDNLAIAIEQVGRILVDLIPHIYDTERVLQVRGEDDSEREIRINQPTIGPEGIAIKNDMRRGRYDVRISTGPSYATRRLEAADSMLRFIQAAPQVQPLVLDLVAKSLDWPGSEEFSERLRNAVPPGIIEEEDPEKQAAQQQLEALQQQQAAIQMAKDQAEVMADQAKAEETMAKTRGLELDNLEKQFEVAQLLGNALLAAHLRQQIVALSAPPPGIGSPVVASQPLVG